MLTKNKILFGVLIISTFFLVVAANAFSISPLKYTLSLDPGDSQDLAVTVKNDSKDDKNYKAVVIGVQQDSQGRPIFKANSDVAENWVKIKNEKMALKNNEQKDFIFTITVPKNSPPGAHYLGIGVKEDGAQNIGGQLLTIVVLQVAGTANESLVLENFSPIKKIFFNRNLAYFFEVKNNGNIDLLMSGKMQIYDFRNSLIDLQPINLGNRLFAQSNRSAEIRPVMSKKIFWPGLYHAMVVVNYGLTNQQVIGSTNFWYCPIWFFGLIVGLVVLVLLRLFLYKKNKHEMVE